MINTKDLIDHYQKYFYTVKVNTNELKKQAYRLRYQVYVEECGYDFAGDFDNKMEKDEYDAYASHSLLFHKPTKKPIGHIRLIPFKEKHSNTLPIEALCNNSFDMDLISLDQLRSIKTGELSRLALVAAFRRRPYDTSIQGSEVIQDDSEPKRRFNINYLPMCLMLASMDLMFELKLEYTVALMESRLQLLFNRYGLQTRKIGHSVEHVGIRAPYFMEVQNAFDNLPLEYKELYKIIHKEMKHETIF